MNITQINNPYCTSQLILFINIWYPLGDFFNCQDEVCRLFRERYGEEPVTLITPPHSKAAPYYAKMLSALSCSIMTTEHVVGLDDEFPLELKQQDILNNRHILIVDETCTTSQEIENALSTISIFYFPMSLTVLCNYGMHKEAERSYFGEHAVLNAKENHGSLFPADKYQVFVQNDHAVYHPAQIHVASHAKQWHVVLYLQNGRIWLVKDYGHRQETDEFEDITVKLNQWLSQPSSLAMGGGLTNRELALGLWEINNPTAMLCRIGYIGSHQEYEVSVHKKDWSYTPHVHIVRLGSDGEAYFETRVKILTNEYYFPLETYKKMRLSRELCMMLAELMEKPSHNLHYKSNYDYARWAWTMNNYVPARKLNNPIPDYRTIYDVIEVRVDALDYF